MVCFQFYKNNKVYGVALRKPETRLICKITTSRKPTRKVGGDTPENPPEFFELEPAEFSTCKFK